MLLTTKNVRSMPIVFNSCPIYKPWPSTEITLAPVRANIAVINLLLVRIRRTVYTATNEVNRPVTINSRLLPIIIPTKRTIEVVPMNPIRASNKIVRSIAATATGIKNSENPS